MKILLSVKLSTFYIYFYFQFKSTKHYTKLHILIVVFRLSSTLAQFWCPKNYILNRKGIYLYVYYWWHNKGDRFCIFYIFYNVTDLSELFFERPWLRLVIPSRGRWLNFSGTTAGHWHVTRVTGLWRQVSSGSRRVSVERGRCQWHGHGGRLLLQLLLVHRWRLYG